MRCSPPSSQPSHLMVMVQYFRALGVVLGLGWRTSTPTALQFPPRFLALLTARTDAQGASELVEMIRGEAILEYEDRSLAGALCTGVRSVFPNGAFELLSGPDVSFLLRGSPTMAGVSALRRRAVYMNEAKPSDTHFILFWTALAEIPQSDYLAIIRTVFPFIGSAVTNETLSLPLLDESEEEDFQGRLTVSLYPPTALAMLCPDGSPMTVFPDKHGISVPKYTSLQVMKERLVAFVISLSLSPGL